MNHPLSKVFSDKQLRLTHPRMAVFDVLRKSDRPLSVHEISTLVKGVNRASLYRTLALFEELGITKHIQLGWKYKIELGDNFAPHHHHFVCQSCGKIIALDEDAIRAFIDNLSRQYGVTTAEHHFELKGLCADCRQ